MEVTPCDSRSGAVIVKDVFRHAFYDIPVAEVVVKYCHGRRLLDKSVHDVLRIAEVNEVQFLPRKASRSRSAVFDRYIFRSVAKFFPCSVGAAEAVWATAMVQNHYVFVMGMH